MTVNELLAELRKLQRAGHGDATVYQMRCGDAWNMATAKVSLASHKLHITLLAPDPAKLWPTGQEQEAVCSIEEAMC
jgi:hypothetical protein